MAQTGTPQRVITEEELAQLERACRDGERVSAPSELVLGVVAEVRRFREELVEGWLAAVDAVRDHSLSDRQAAEYRAQALALSLLARRCGVELPKAPEGPPSVSWSDGAGPLRTARCICPGFVRSTIGTPHVEGCPFRQPGPRPASADKPPQLGGGATEAEIETAIDVVAEELRQLAVGMVMRQLRGQANPSTVAQLLRQRLGRRLDAPEAEAARLRAFVASHAFIPCHHDGPGLECIGCGRWASSVDRLDRLVHTRDCELAEVLGLRLRG